MINLCCPPGSSDSVEQVMDQVEKYIMTRLYKSVFCPETTDDEKKDLATQTRIRWALYLMIISSNIYNYYKLNSTHISRLCTVMFCFGVCLQVLKLQIYLPELKQKLLAASHIIISSRNYVFILSLLLSFISACLSYTVS